MHGHMLENIGEIYCIAQRSIRTFLMIHFNNDVHMDVLLNMTGVIIITY